ncbi:hypothetical protein E2542_SST31247 [Spatholobus suberectus]|nr:hypothetical protein E2542_SST31247 [Spatholobus suberectus]
MADHQRLRIHPAEVEKLPPPKSSIGSSRFLKIRKGERGAGSVPSSITTCYASNTPITPKRGCICKCMCWTLSLLVFLIIILAATARIL